MLIWYESQTNHICDGLLNGQIQSAALAWKSLLIFLLEHFPRWLVQSQTPQTPKPRRINRFYVLRVFLKVKISPWRMITWMIPWVLPCYQPPPYERHFAWDPSRSTTFNDAPGVDVVLHHSCGHLTIPGRARLSRPQSIAGWLGKHHLCCHLAGRYMECWPKRHGISWKR